MAKLDRTLTAAHEAGHVLAAMVWGGNVESVTIEPDETREGHFRRRGIDPFALASRAPLRERRRILLGEARVNLAGLAAEELFQGETPELLRKAFHDEGRSLSDWCLVDPAHDLAIVSEALCQAYPHGHTPLEHRAEAQYRHVLAFLTTNRHALRALTEALLTATTLQAGRVFEVVDNTGLNIAGWVRRGMPRLEASTAEVA